MTEHLQSQLKDAAHDVREIKEKQVENDEQIAENSQLIMKNNVELTSLQHRIDGLNLFNGLLRTKEQVLQRNRSVIFQELNTANERLTFFTNELVEHPYLGA